MREYQVYPGEDGWNWRLVEGEAEDQPGQEVEAGEGYATRAEAITAARDHRGDEYVSSADQLVLSSRGPERLVIHREDGSYVGEVDHTVQQGLSQDVDIEPATEETS